MVNQFELGSSDTVVSLWDNSLNVNQIQSKKGTRQDKFKF